MTFVSLVVSMSSPGQAADKGIPAGPPARLSFLETVAYLNTHDKADEATFLTQQMERVLRITKNANDKNCGVMFGRLVVSKADNPRLCDAQMEIHKSGWFVTDVGDIEKPVEFRMWGFQALQVFHGGDRGGTVNVGDVILKPYQFEHLATVRAELLFEGKVDPSEVIVNVVMEHPPTNTVTEGTDGFISRPEKELVSIGPDLRIQKSGLSPILHFITIKVPGHQPFRREFKLETAGTTDLGVLRVATSPAFEVEFAIADGLDFSAAERRKQTVFAGDQFKTNLAGKEWYDAGTMKIQERRPTSEESKLRIEDRPRAYSFHCGLASLIVTDLGEGRLEDHLKPVHSKPPRGEVIDPAILDGHVYLITHSASKMWKHSTLMRVRMSGTPKE